jgi:SH3 domain protein
MNKVFLKTLSFLILASSMQAPVAAAQSAWVTDEFEITLRSGPSTSNAIQLMVSSGTELTVLERDADSGYTKVRTAGGTEGWVLTRYLMNERSAREQLQRLSSQLTNATSRGSSLNTQLASIKSEYDTAQKTISQLQSEKQQLEEELAEIKRTAANVLSINARNRELGDELAVAETNVAVLEQENRALTSQNTRYWFMSGGLVLVVGIILGLWLPRIRWQRRSRYDRF